MASMLIALLIISAILFKTLPVFAVGIACLFLQVYPAQTLTTIFIISILYYLIKDKLP